MNNSDSKLVSKKVLVIDDDGRNIFALTAVLRGRGWETLKATNVKDALKLLSGGETSIGVILMDIMMPDLDGFEAIRLLKSMDGLTSIPIIAVTARAMPGDKEKCLAAGADDYVSKPVDVDLLCWLLEKYLNQ
ncbi:MAG: response regulator [Flavisolibacter sp.]